MSLQLICALLVLFKDESNNRRITIIKGSVLYKRMPVWTRRRGQRNTGDKITPRNGVMLHSVEKLNYFYTLKLSVPRRRRKMCF